MLRSEVETLVGGVLQVLLELRADLGIAAFMALGILLLAGIVAGVFVIRWCLRGGPGRGARMFFAERRLIEQYLKEH